MKIQSGDITFDVPDMEEPAEFGRARQDNELRKRLAAGPQTHVVRAGENLAALAQHVGVPVEEIVRANGLYSDLAIEVGQLLRIPARRVPLT